MREADVGSPSADTGRAISDYRISRPGLIWPRGSQSLMGNFEGSNRSSRSRISTEKDDADQPRRIDKHGPMLLTGVATVDTDETRGLSALVVRPERTLGPVAR